MNCFIMLHQVKTVDYQQIENSNIANQIHGFTIDYGKFIRVLIVKYQMHAHGIKYVH